MNNIKLPYFLPRGNGINIKNDKIIEYRVIVEFKNKDISSKQPEIYCFPNLDDAKIFSKKLNNYHYLIIKVIVLQDGFYLDDVKGKYIDEISKKRYSYIQRKRYSELFLSEFNKKYLLAFY